MVPDSASQSASHTKKDSLLRKHGSKFLFSFAGAVVGYFLIHPYAMLVYLLMAPVREGDIFANWHELTADALRAFESIMLPMAGAFAFLCSIIGLMLGVIVEKRRDVLIAEYENRQKQVAVDSMKRLIVILSHYFLNADMIIGGHVRRLRRLDLGEDVVGPLDVIEIQAKKTEAVVSALTKITEGNMTDISPQTHEGMVEITREIEKQLKEIEKARKSVD